MVLSNGSWRRLRRVTVVGLAGLIVAGLLVYRNQNGPGQTWRNLIHGPDRAARSDAWAKLLRDREIRGLDPAETIGEVLAALADPDAETRLHAVSVLPVLDAEPGRAIAALAEKLTDPDIEVRAGAASALGLAFRRGGPGRDEAIAAIKKALDDGVPAVRAAGLASLGQILYETGQAVDPLRSGQADDPSLGLAKAKLEDADPGVRAEAACVLACNDRGREAVPMLETFLKAQPAAEPPTHAADRAFLAMMVLAIHSDKAAAFLGDQIAERREGSPDRPRDALVWAAKQTPEARTRVKRVATRLLDPANLTLRHNVGLLLHRIGSDQPARPILIEALDDPSVEIRLAAVEAIAEIGTYDPSIASELDLATEDDDEGVRQRAVAAIEAIEWAELMAELEGPP